MNPIAPLRRPLGIALMAWSAAVTLPASAAADPAVDLLERALHAEQHRVFRGVVDVNGESRIRISQGIGRKQRHEVINPADMAGDLVIDNGSVRWHLSPNHRNVDVSPSDTLPLGVPERFALVRANYGLAITGQATVAGEPVTILTLTPRHPHRPVHRLSIPDRGLPLHVERLWPGQPRQYSRFLNIDWKPDLAADTFDPHLPAGTKVTSTVRVQASARHLADLKPQPAFRPRLPQALPAGFQVVKVRLLTSVTEKPTIHWQFTDGMISVSLFAREASRWATPPGARTLTLTRGVRGAILSRGDQRMVLWQSGGVRYSLVGALAEPALIEAARSTLE